MIATKPFSETFTKACKSLMLAEPFYGIFLMMVNKETDESIQTLCVGLKDITFKLKVNPTYWDSLPPEVQLGRLKHECLHLINFHLTDFGHCLNREIANMAMDCEINQYVPEENRGEGGIFPHSFPHLKLEPFKGTNYYYEKLMQAKDKQDKDIQAILDALANGESSCELPSTGETVKIERHQWEVESSDMSEGTRRILQAQVGKLIKEAADQVTKSRGTIPGNIQEILDRLNQVDPPKFDWKGYIRRFVGCSTKYYVKKSRRKLNVRFADNPGQRVKQHKHIMLGIDTSGSVSSKELKEFQNEMHHIQMNGTTITVVQCDSAISHIESFNPRKDFEVYGRGGTSFQPFIDYYNEHKRDFSCLIIFTDGEAPNPQNVQGNVLWVLSSQSHFNKNLTGQIIQLN